MTEGRRPQSVLFACTLNAVRSPMAEAAARYFFGKEIFIASAGVKKGETDPFAVTVMDDIGIDMSKHRPRTFDELDDDGFDMIVTLSPEAHHAALEFTRTSAVEVIYWPTFDPTSVQGSREQILDAYRDVRDRLIRQIKQRLSP